MGISSILDTIVEVTIVQRPKEPHRFHVCPGDWVCLEPNCILLGDVPLKGLTTMQALEREAFTGKAGTEVSGWIRTGDVALVVAVDEDEAYLWSREGKGRGWIDRQFVCSIHDVKSEYDPSHEPARQEG